MDRSQASARDCTFSQGMRGIRGIRVLASLAGLAAWFGLSDASAQEASQATQRAAAQQGGSREVGAAGPSEQQGARLPGPARPTPVSPEVVQAPSAGSGLLRAGAATFGGFWLASALTAGVIEIEQEPCKPCAGKKWKEKDSDDHLHLLIPVAGPFVALGTMDVSGSEAAGLALLGVGQVAGLALVAAGAAAAAEVRVYQRGDTQVRVGPTVAPGRLGLSLSGDM